MSLPLESLLSRLARAGRIWLFLDYDGTLADFAPTPDHVQPQLGLIELLTRLAAHPQVRLAVISGRRLDHVETLVPIPGVILAGTYGVEMREQDGSRVNRVAGEQIRLRLEKIKTQWGNLLQERDGFYLEDKGWAVALHARFADDTEADEVIASARRAAEFEKGVDAFRILGGHKFLEVVPLAADKGRTIEQLLRQYPWENAIPIYIGDDDKDELAFSAVNNNGGISIVVAREPRASEAQYRLETPGEVRRWLAGLTARLDEA
jgi:trehalose 6-phosphate phosphatase